MRLLFVPDSHGSTLVLNKSLETAGALGTDILILAGDLSGKTFVPFIETNGCFCRTDHNDGKRWSEDALREFEEHELQYGRYILSLTKEDHNLALENHMFATELMVRVVLQHLRNWIAHIKEHQSRTDVTVFLCPGNDDHYEVDDVIREEETEMVRLGKDNAIEYRGITIISMGDVTPTPWSTYRELPEDKMREKIDRLVQTVDNSVPLILNFHCPPKPTKLDLAPELESDLRPVLRGGSQIMTHVGSEAVYDALRQYQPLAGLHGHVHESPGIIKIGTTIAVNPGCEYEQGMMKGFLFDIEDDCIVRHSRIER